MVRAFFMATSNTCVRLSIIAPPPCAFDLTFNGKNGEFVRLNAQITAKMKRRRRGSVQIRACSGAANRHRAYLGRDPKAGRTRSRYARACGW